MKRYPAIILAAIFCITILSFSPAQAEPLTYFTDYMYLTNEEMTMFNEIIWFWTPDTLYGRVHSNSRIGIKFRPSFYGQVSTTERDFARGAGYNPYFAYDPIFNAPHVYIPYGGEEGRLFMQYTELARYVRRALCEYWQA
ncbi:hypothetical protein ACFLQJ_02190 [Calditrichota bacterium]